MSFQIRQGFWREAFALHGSITPKVMPNVLIFGLAASGICGASWLVETQLQVRIALAVAPFEFAGAALGVLLILRTNAGYDRWWEARKLWGGIVNQSRNLATAALHFGPADPAWRADVVRWTAAFGHAVRRGLRGERDLPELAALLGPAAAGRVVAARNMGAHVAAVLAG